MSEYLLKQRASGAFDVRGNCDSAPYGSMSTVNVASHVLKQLEQQLHSEVARADLTLETHGVLPATVQLQPATLRLEAVPLTVTPGSPPASTRQDLILSALIVVYVCLAYVCLTSRPLPESLIEPLAGALGLLAWVYDRQ